MGELRINQCLSGFLKVKKQPFRNSGEGCESERLAASVGNTALILAGLYGISAAVSGEHFAESCVGAFDTLQVFVGIHSAPSSFDDTHGDV